MKRTSLAALCLGLCFASAAPANDWVYGTVQIVDEYSSYGTGAGEYQVMVTLANKVWTVPAHASICTDRFRIVIGLEGMTEEVKKRMFAMLLTAYTTGSKVRLFYNPATGPYCAVQLASIGDL
jgi:hypothetical protein